MEKRLRSAVQSSAEEFLSSAAKLGLKSAKPSLKSLIHGLSPASELASSLPVALLQAVSQSISRFKQLLHPCNVDPLKSPQSPLTKRLRRSSRRSKKGDDSGTNDREHKRVDESQRVVQKLQIYAYVALLCVSHPKKAFRPWDLLPAVQELHNNLVVFESDSVLLSEIASLCEEWWKEGLPGRESLIQQSLPFLVSRSLTLKKKVDVHRVYTLREAFTLFDFEDDSIEDLKLLLIRCLIAPLYLKTEDGRKFIAFMFGLSGQLLKESLAMIRSQIPFGRKSMLEAYADILFRAWKVAEGPLREEIENGFLQGLIEGAIHAHSSSFAASIRRVLGGFTNQRTTDGVEKLLFRLAEPVLFRSLQVANSNVRQNALHLLLDLFPLEDPHCTKEAKDTLLDKQFFLLEKSLMDECPDIRAIAVEGSCRILYLFWEIIPSPTITRVLSRIFYDTSYDSCSEVRLSSLSGVTYLLKNPQSHEILKVLLPRVGHLVMDPAISTRAALMDLLLVLRDIRTFQFHKVVHLDVLLSTLANDQPLIAQKITKLLMPSYFPSKVTVDEACQRCVTLIKRSPLAGARFCEFAPSEGASSQYLMELIKVFISLVQSHDKLAADQIDGLLVASAHLCNNLVSESSYKDALKNLLSGEKLRCLFVAAATGRAQSSVFDIISSISSDDVGGLFDECMALVTDCSGLSENAEKQNQVRSAHKMMLSCNWFDKMFEYLMRLLEKIARGCHNKFGTEITSQSLPRRKIKPSIRISRKHVSRKKSSSTAVSKFEEDYLISVGIAWQIKDLLLNENAREAMLKSQVLETTFYSLRAISEVSILQCVHCDYMDVFPVFAYTALALHMSLQNVSGAYNYGTKKKASLDSGGSTSEPTLLEQTMNHLFSCTSKIFGVDDPGKPAESKQERKKTARHRGQRKRESESDTLHPGDGGFVNTNQKRISNAVKILTAVLKFVVDAAAINLISQSQEKCFEFTLDYIKFIMSSLRKNSCDKLPFNEEILREIFLCLKSSFTYAAKLLNLILASSSEVSPLHLEAYNLANGLLDLIVSVELFMGSGYAKRLLASMKPWLPDMVLALGSRHMPIHRTEAFESASSCDKSCFPLWPSILAKIELHEMSEASQDEEVDRISLPVEFSAFRELMEMMALLLRGNAVILDAVGVSFLTATAVALERKDFGLVLGLLQFICGKLVRHEKGEWAELELMLACLHDVYPQIERVAEELNGSRDARQILESAMVLLQPVWTSYVSDAQKDSFEEA
ncbi:uncharacterized protein LOC127803610 [Diospyros lotus]|uniref:uncharacterized protein LOC127803610 n=1 Tax=Diospyros lotus TaxID=55363 RepID=UPI00224F4D9B|nr:uncharacterized protein LOC127803610 [Diospyros lotus]